MTAKDRHRRARAPAAGRPAPPPERRPKRRALASLPETTSLWNTFYRIIRRIPIGRVCTYGAIAAMAGHPRAARHVGHALSALKETGDAGVPWHRVLGSRPRRRAAISIHDPAGAELQRMLLEAEGIELDDRDHVALDRFGWFSSTPLAPQGRSERGAAPRKRRA